MEWYIFRAYVKLQVGIYSNIEKKRIPLSQVGSFVGWETWVPFTQGTQRTERVPGPAPRYGHFDAVRAIAIGCHQVASASGVTARVP